MNAKRKFTPPKSGGNTIPQLNESAADELVRDALPNMAKNSGSAKTGSVTEASSGKLIVPDARFKPDSEKQTEQMIVRMTLTERDNLNEAFKKSDFRYMNQYLRVRLMQVVEEDLK